jgi:hypothetical protein
MNSPENYLFIISIFVLLSQVESFPSNKILCDPSNVNIEPGTASQKILIGYSVENRKGNPEEKGPYFEGDIIRTSFRDFRKAPNKWTNKTVPYQIAGTFSELFFMLISNFTFPNLTLQLLRKGI